MEAEHPNDDLQEPTVSETPEQESTSILEPQSPGEADESQYEDASSQLEGVTDGMPEDEAESADVAQETGSDEDIQGQEVDEEPSAPQTDTAQV